MSKVLGTIGKVAGVIALIPSPIQPIAAAVAIVASVGSALLAKPPRRTGSSTDITIGANMPSPQILGECYYGGNRVLQVGYGTDDKIKNAYAGIVDVYSVGGPVNALVGAYTDFTLQTFTGTMANGYYVHNLYRRAQLGQSPEPSALTPNWAGCPDWGAAYKLSGMAAIFWGARFPAKGDVFRSGLPQFGAVWRGVPAYDPRYDGTYPGGAGAQRWASPANVAAFDAAKGSWGYTRNPGLHALRYALGSWERGPGAGTTYQLTFGMGLPIDGIVVADFVEFANVCDANGWTVNGVIFEPGDRWENLKNICAAGAAEPCIKGGRLGLRITAPRVSLDTITEADLADDDVKVPATRSYRERLNTIVPKYKSSAHKWEYVASNPVKVLDYVTQDGEERSEERQYNLVAGDAGAATQAAQLGAYDLVGGRERAPFDIALKPRLRRYRPGDQLNVHLPRSRLINQPCVILRRRFDPATMKVTLTMREEIVAKHAFALGQTGTTPPAISIYGPEDNDETANGTTAGLGGARQISSQSVPFPLTSDTSHIYVAAFAGVVDGISISFPAGTLSGLADSTFHGVFFAPASTAFSAVAAPALAQFEDSALVFIGWQATSSGGSTPTYPPAPTPPPGTGGGGRTPNMVEN